MEQAVAKLCSETQTKLDQILQTIARLSQTLPAETTTPASRELSEPSAEHHCPRMAHPAVLPDFDGDRAKGKVFLNACQTYFRLCPKEFADEQTKIIWAMSYMKTGRTQKWTDQVLQWEQQSPEACWFLDGDDFEKEF